MDIYRYEQKQMPVWAECVLISYYNSFSDLCKDSASSFSSSFLSDLSKIALAQKKFRLAKTFRNLSKRDKKRCVLQNFFLQNRNKFLCPVFYPFFYFLGGIFFENFIENVIFSYFAFASHPLM